MRGRRTGRSPLRSTTRKKLRAAKSWAGVGAAILTVFGIAALLGDPWGSTGPGGRPPPPPSSQAPALWSQGQRLTLSISLDHRASSRVPLPDSTEHVRVRSRLDARLVADVLGVDSRGQQVRFRFLAIDEASIAVGGRPSRPAGDLADALSRVTIRARFPADGGPSTFSVERGEDPEVARMTQVLVSALGWRLAPPGETSGWRLEGQAQYRLEAPERPGEPWTRRLKGLSELGSVPDALVSSLEIVASGAARVWADPKGLTRLEEEVEVSAREGSTTWTDITSRLRVERTAVDLAPPAASSESDTLSDYRADQAIEAEAARRQLLVARVGDLDIDDVLGRLRDFTTSEGRPDDKRFVWRAVGLLELHPELAEVLANKYFDEGLTVAARDRILDLLAAARVPEAQRALVGVLRGLEGQKASGDLAEGLKRLMLLDSVEADTAKAALHFFGSSDPFVKMSATFALGALAAKLGASDPASAKRLNGVLRDALAEEEDANRQMILIDALGNAGQPENVPLLAPWSKSERPELRAHVAYALRHTDTPEARDLLDGLAGDEHELVQARAYAVLAQLGRLAPERVERTVRRIGQGSVDARSFGFVAHLLRTHADHPPAREGLEALRRHPKTDAELRGRIQAFLEELDT